MSGGETYVGSVELQAVAQARNVLTVDASLVRQRIYTPGGERLMADIGCTPQAARAYAALLIKAADRIDPPRGGKGAA